MNTKYSDERILIKASKSSIRRFIKFFLGINHTHYCFHQTLTFRERLIDSKLAKAYLKQLLDSVENAFPQMTALFIQGIQERGGIHFHVIFLFFGQQPEPPDMMRSIFGREVFTRWNAIHGRNLIQSANRITLQINDIDCIDYLLRGHISVANEPLSLECHWHGDRNRELLLAHWTPPSKQQVNETFSGIFTKPRKRVAKLQPLPPLFTRHDLESIRGYIEGRNKIDWASFKRCELGTNKRVSDATFIEFKNRERNRIILRRHPELADPEPDF